MTIFTLYSCVKRFLRFFVFAAASLNSLYAQEPIFLQFIPEVPVELYSVISLLKEVKVQGGPPFSFFGHQGVETALTLKEKPSSASFFPLDLSLTLNKIAFKLKSNDKQISFDSEKTYGSLEMAEFKMLAQRPLQITLKDLESPAVMEPRQQKLFGNLSLFNASFLRGLLEEDFKELFVLADEPLTEGATFRITKKLNEDLPVELEVVYTILKITEDQIDAVFVSKIERQKVTFDFFTTPMVEKQKAVAVITGETRGEISWKRHNSLLVEMEAMSSFQTALKALGVEAQIHMDVQKEMSSRLML